MALSERLIGRCNWLVEPIRMRLRTAITVFALSAFITIASSLLVWATSGPIKGLRHFKALFKQPGPHCFAFFCVQRAILVGVKTFSGLFSPVSPLFMPAPHFSSGPGMFFFTQCAVSIFIKA